MGYDIATRAQVVTLKAFTQLNPTQIKAITGVPDRTQRDIYKRAKARGFDPDIQPAIVRDEYLNDGARSGRPTKQTDEVKAQVFAKVSRDRYGREKSCQDIANEIPGVSEKTVWRILRAAGYRKTKPTRKPGLSAEQRTRRLEWCIQHQNWTLDDWKNVIWSDETSVVIGHRRGGYKIWRKADERYIKSCIRRRWKGYAEFMFWGCFSWDYKGPCHIWHTETPQERKKADIDLARINTELEPIRKAEWELNILMTRLRILKNVPGRKPKWVWNEDHGKLTRGGGNGVDWYRYQKEIIIKKMIPFVKQCIAAGRPGTIVQEDGAPSHIHHAQSAVYSLHQISTLLWPGNSPDIAMIEPCWPHMKRDFKERRALNERASGESLEAVLERY